MEEKEEYTKKSIIVKKFGGYEVLEIAPFLLPKLNGMVEVKVHYCGLNFADLYTRQGLMPHQFPFVLGMECSGVVMASDDDKFKCGDHVICYSYEGGMYSDTIRIPPKNCYIIPDDIDLISAASIFVNYLTAYFSLFSIGNLQPNQDIFIPSLNGGVGIAATQLASTVENVRIFGTATKTDAIKHNNVKHIFSYENLESSLAKHCPSGFDIILETQSGRDRNLFEKYLKPLGKIVFLGANSVITDTKRISKIALMKMWWSRNSISELDLVMNNRVVAGLHLGLLAEKEPLKIRTALDKICALLKDGKINPQIHAVKKFEEIVDATKLLAERKNIGKVLLQVEDC